MPGRLRPSPRLLTAALLSTLAAAFVGWMTLANGSTPAVDSNTPIKHVVVIFDENESFDHYFATYPNAAGFSAVAPDSPVDNLQSANLLAPNNPNSRQPSLIARSNALTCDANHGYADEQKAYNGGAMNKFPEFTGGGCPLVMGYFDGTTVTGLWNLAQHFTLNDNFFGSTFGPSTPGAINLISGNTSGAGPAGTSGITGGTMIADPDPALDDCGNGPATMSGQNIGDLLNTRGVTWGWFQGGFRPTSRGSDGKAVCGAQHKNIGGATIADYSAHHEPFMYYASTANQHHLPPTSVANIGHSDQAKHQYDLADFDDAVKADNLPQVSFLKAAQFEDAHPGSSDPVDEQAWIARVIDEVQQSPDWASTAIVITYDDSDGWYDHVDGVTQGSNNGVDSAVCTGAADAANPAYQGRCGPGPRLPILVVSPWAKVNHVDHTQLEQTSVTRFIEDNWSLGQIGGNSFDARAGAGALQSMFDFVVGDARAPKVYLDPASGQVVGSPPSGLVTSPGTGLPTTTTTTTTGTTTTTATSPPAATTPVTTTPRPPATTTPRTTATLKPKLASVKTKRSGKKVTLTFKVTGVSAAAGRLTASAKLTLRRKTVATAATKTIRSGRASFTLRARKTIKKGKYVLTLRFRQGRLAKTVTATITIK